MGSERSEVTGGAVTFRARVRVLVRVRARLLVPLLGDDGIIVFANNRRYCTSTKSIPAVPCWGSKLITQTLGQGAKEIIKAIASDKMLSTSSTRLAKSAVNRLLQKQSVRSMGTTKSFVSERVSCDVMAVLARMFVVWNE